MFLNFKLVLGRRDVLWEHELNFREQRGKTGSRQMAVASFVTLDWPRIYHLYPDWSSTLQFVIFLDFSIELNSQPNLRK